MSKTPVDTSGDLKVREASHLSNLPSIATDASTSNLIELSTGVTLKTGTPSSAWAWLTHENIIESKMQKRLSLIVGGLLFSALLGTNFSRSFRVPRLYSLWTPTLKLSSSSSTID